MTNQRTIIQLLFLLTMALSAFGQEDKTDEKFIKVLYEEANTHMQNGLFEEAKKTYAKLIELAPNDAVYHMEYGIACLESNDVKGNSVKLLQMARLKTNGTPSPTLLYYLGRAYQNNHRYDEAIQTYNELLGEINDDKKLEDLREETELRIKMCQHGLYHLGLHEVNPMTNKDKYNDMNRYFTSPTDYVIIENLGLKINSPFHDYSPIPLQAGSFLALTSRRYLENRNENYYIDGNHYENIYVSRWRNGKWEDVIEVDYSSNFDSGLKNKTLHNAVLSVSHDGQTMLVLFDGAVHLSEFDNNMMKWSSPKVIEGLESTRKINFFSAHINKSKDKIYVSAEVKKEGYGGRDLYVIEKSGDAWGELKNLGAVLNTELDDDSPILSNDERTLFFASKGHSSIGGYDIFKSELKDGEWSTPVNLGIPINTPKDEIHYFPAQDNSFAYYASNRDGGYGDFDIYKIFFGQIDLEKRIDPTAQDNLLSNVLKQRTSQELNYLSSFPQQTSAKMDDLVSAIKKEQAITKDLLAEEEKTDSETSVLSGAISDEKIIDQEIAEEIVEEVIEEEEQIADEIVEEQVEIVEELKEVPVKEVKKEVDDASQKDSEEIQISKDKAMSAELEKLVVDLPFGLNGTELSPEIKQQLDALKKYLDTNPNTVVTFVGHTDSSGTEEVNMVISKMRAVKVFDYMYDQGADVFRINYDYKGESEPKFSNATRENREKNRRVDIEVEQNLIFAHVQFGFDSDIIADEYQGSLKQIATYMKQNANTKADLRGFTDSQGNKAYNKQLSQRRAKAVAKILQAEGIEDSRVEIGFFGSDKPTIPNNNPQNRELNRRVEIRVN